MSAIIISYGIMALVAVLSVLGLVLTRYVLSAISNNWLRGATARLWDAVHDAVLEVGNTYVDALKDAGEDGEWTKTEKDEALARAIVIAKSNFGWKALAELAKVLGIEDVDKWIGSKVETAVAEDKRLGKLQAQ